MQQYIPTIPTPFLNESLASWIQRICQVYDLTLNRFHESFPTLSDKDIDLCLTSRHLGEIIKKYKISASHVQLINESFCRLAERPNLQSLLLMDVIDGYSYRFCPACWATDKIPYMRIEWRFRTSEYCFVHHSNLQSACHSCGKCVPIHRSILGGSIMPPPASNLAMCFYCRADLRKTPDDIELNLKAATQLKNRVNLQKAIISAVLHNYFVIAPFPEKYSLDHLPVMLDGAGLHILNAGASTMLFTTFENGSLNTLRKILCTALRGNTWLKAGHPIQRKLSRKAANLRKQKVAN